MCLASGKGYVTRFPIAEKFLDRYQVREVGGKDHLKYWIPAEGLGAFNDRPHWPDRSRSRVRLMPERLK
jgi:hypothetical protein